MTQDTGRRTWWRHQAAVMPVKMNAISSHRKWCQNVSSEVGSKCKRQTEFPSLPHYPSGHSSNSNSQHQQEQQEQRRRTPVVILPLPRLLLSGIPCNPSHGKCDQEQEQDEVLDHDTTRTQRRRLTFNSHC
ncbi:hypothetical protein ACLKA6_011306 [Drosophila palustris]